MLYAGIEERARQMAASEAFDSIRDDILLDELKDGIRHFWSAFLHAERAGAAPSTGELRFIRERAAQRAREMVPLPKGVEALVTAQAFALESIAEAAECGDWPEGEAVSMMLRLADFSTRVISAFLEAYIQTARAEQEERDVERADLLEEMLAYGPDTPRWLLRRAAALGVDTGRGQVVLICKLLPGPLADHSPAPLRSTGESLARLSGRGAHRAFVVVRQSDIVAVMDSADESEAPLRLEHLRRATWSRQQAHLLAGIGTTFTGLNDFRASYTEASRALRHACLERPIVRSPLDLTLVDDFVVSSRRTASIIVPQQIRGALKEPMVRLTLLSYLDADANVADTAQALNLHPNTVRNRLDRIADTCGLDPRIASHLFELTTAVRILVAAEMAVDMADSPVSRPGPARVGAARPEPVDGDLGPMPLA